MQFLEQQLADYQKREEDLVLLLENSPGKMASLDASLHLVVAGQTFINCFHSIFGRQLYPKAPFLSLLDEKGVEFWEPHLQQALQGERQIAQISQQIKGQSFVFEIILQPVWQAQQVHRILVFCQDISAQHQAEAEVQEHSVNLSSALRIASAGSWEFDITNQTIRISEEALCILGIYDQAELVLSLEEFAQRFLYPDDIALLQDRIAYAFTFLDDPTFRDIFEYRLIDVQGKVLHLILRSRYKSNAKGVIYGVTQDITEQKAMLSQLKMQNAQLKKVNAELDNFVYSVSHDLRAPLTSVLGLVNVMRLEDDPTRLLDYLDLQEKSVQKLDYFIREIIDLSRNARLAPRYETIDPETIVQESFSQQSYDERAKQVTQHHDLQTTQTVVSDKSRVMIVLNNLVSNAIRYADLRKPDPYVTVQMVADVHHLNIQVYDNGIGIEAKYIANIYEMFFRASETHSGSGLGLYIVKETVDKLGGTIQVESELGKGTRFTVSLPNHATN